MKNVFAEIEDWAKRQPERLLYISRTGCRALAGWNHTGWHVRHLVRLERESCGADLHARYLLTDRGGMNVEAGFSAEGCHQKVHLGLLDLAFCQDKIGMFARGSTAYELVEPVLEISSNGTVRRVSFA